MTYKRIYKTSDEFDDILLESDGEYLTGLSFLQSNNANDSEIDLPIFKETIDWLDIYFGGKNPSFTPKYKIDNLTLFRKNVLDILKMINYGATLTYGDIAKMIAKKRGIKRMSSQAVGGAVGWNPICIIIPCHRVIGANGNLTGYGGGMKNKIALLNHERISTNNFYVPNNNEDEIK